MKRFLIGSLLLILFTGIAGYFFPKVLLAYFFIFPLMALGVYDLTQKKHAILRNYPVLGHIRYLSEFIAPEIHQYFVESDIDGRPFSRLQRNFVYKRAKKRLETHPFGTELNVYEPGYYWMAHSMYPQNELAETPRVKFGGSECTQPYLGSIFNISAMSFGSLGMNAVSALNKGAKLGGFYHNTGEGGISDYHLKYGADLVWQIGTAYFGCRDEKGNFSEIYFAENSNLPSVKMIEIKLSQGAKPGLGGVLPATKNTEEIAKIRRIKPHELVHSPPAHQAFSDAPGLLKFVQKLRKLSGGKPVGFKLCVGSRKEFTDICKAMIETGILPDFITVDGGEGGTGAAPIEFSDNVGMPLEDALVFVCDTLTGYGLKKDIRIIASCKVVTGFDIVRHMAIGADACNCARGMMFALGCIQALECDRNTCPTGVATQDQNLQKGLVVEDKGLRVANFHEETVKSALSMLTAAGLTEISKLNRSFIYKRLDHIKIQTLEQVYPYQEEGALLINEKAHGEDSRETTAPKPAKQGVQQSEKVYPSHTTKKEEKESE